jgi:hypothetical protein
MIFVASEFSLPLPFPKFCFLHLFGLVSLLLLMAEYLVLDPVSGLILLLLWILSWVVVVVLCSIISRLLQVLLVWCEELLPYWWTWPPYSIYDAPFHGNLALSTTRTQTWNHCNACGRVGKLAPLGSGLRPKIQELRGDMQNTWSILVIVGSVVALAHVKRHPCKYNSFSSKSFRNQRNSLVSRLFTRPLLLSPALYTRLKSPRIIHSLWIVGLVCLILKDRRRWPDEGGMGANQNFSRKLGLYLKIDPMLLSSNSTKTA